MPVTTATCDRDGPCQTLQCRQDVVVFLACRRCEILCVSGSSPVFLSTRNICFNKKARAENRIGFRRDVNEEASYLKRHGRYAYHKEVFGLRVRSASEAALDRLHLGGQ
eukprot:1427925-Rhodomonas_salina.2